MDFDGHPVVVYAVQRHGLSALHNETKSVNVRSRSARTPEAAEKYKKLFLKQLELGRAPGVSYEERQGRTCDSIRLEEEDQTFAAAWVDAVETGLDRLETHVYNSGLAGNASNAQFILKHRRRDVFGNVEDRPEPSNFILNITLEEQLKRLERLGLPLPVIESDYEEDDEPKQTIQQSR